MYLLEEGVGKERFLAFGNTLAEVLIFCITCWIYYLGFFALLVPQLSQLGAVLAWS